jgi:hypothetical protein
MLDDAMCAFGEHFRDIQPAATLVETACLARPTQLIGIEFDAVLMDDAVGTTARDSDGDILAPSDQYHQARVCFEIIEAALEEAGAPPR